MRKRQHPHAVKIFPTILSNISSYYYVGKDYQYEGKNYNYLKNVFIHNSDAKEPVVDAGIKDAMDFKKQKVEIPVANSLMVGQTFTAGDFKYKITERSMSNGKKGTAAISGIAPAAAGKSSLSTAALAANSDGCKYDVTSIGAKAFQNSKKLKKVKIGSTIKTIGSSAFKKCTKLTGVTYNKIVKSVGASTYEGCASLSKITLGSKVKSIGKSAFKGCKKLSKISISQKVKVSKGAFKGCKKTIKVSGKKTNKKYTVAQIKKFGYKKVK